MRYLILVLMTVLLLAGVYFYSLNQDIFVDTVDVGFTNYDQAPLFIIVFITLGIGIIWALLVFLVQEIRLRLKMMQIRGENKKLKKELDLLRMQPLQEIEISNLPEEELS